MRILQLVENLKCEVLGSDTIITGLSCDSRLVNEGEVFFAISGLKFDGHDYVEEAVKNGAVAVVVEKTQNVAPNITQIVVENTRVAMGEMAAAYYQYPSSKLKVIGITGTNGKTTTSYLIRAVLKVAGYKVGLIGTIYNLIEDEIIPSKRTTPESLDLQRLLAEMVDKGVDYVVIEVSSHALELQRTSGLEFDLGVFTNLTQDHLDFHNSFEQYFAAKAKLFNNLARQPAILGKAAVINFDDKYGLKMAAQSSAPIYSYGINQPSHFSACDIQVGSRGVKYRLITPFGQMQLNLNLTGKFNVYNSLAAAAVCLAEGIGLDYVKAGLEQVKGVFGRFESVDQGQDFMVIVDYAHTPDSLANVLQTARSLSTNRVIAVFGAGGDRDQAKRPLMGQAAAKFSDYIIITSDNPRSEDPMLICRQIEKGVAQESKEDLLYEIEINRRTAINSAIRLAKTGDVVIIAGKGHETYQEFADHTEAFDDRVEAERALKELLT